MYCSCLDSEKELEEIVNSKYGRKWKNGSTEGKGKRKKSEKDVSQKKQKVYLFIKINYKDKVSKFSCIILKFEILLLCFLITLVHKLLESIRKIKNNNQNVKFYDVSW